MCDNATSRKYKEELPIVSKKQNGLVQLCKQLAIHNSTIHFILIWRVNQNQLSVVLKMILEAIGGERDDEIWQ